MGLQELWAYPEDTDSKANDQELHGVGKMNSKSISIILSAIKIQCPLCKYTCNVKSNTFNCRSRYTLRMHLNKNHTPAEIDKYAKKII